MKEIPAMKKGQDIFLPVTDQFERDRVLTDVVRSSTEIKIKSHEPRAAVFILSPRSINLDLISCKLIGSAYLVPNQAEVVAQFHLGEHQYLSQVFSTLQGDMVKLHFSGPLYRVQRREDFRLKIPSSFHGRFVMNKIVIGKVLDISAGGLRLESEASLKIQKGQVLKGLLTLADRDDLEVEMSVRHVATSAESEKLNVIGMQFVNQSVIAKNRMAALVMDIYRELFSRS